MSGSPRYPYASLADIRSMEAQLQADYPGARLALSCGCKKHGTRSPWLIKAQLERRDQLLLSNKNVPAAAKKIPAAQMAGDVELDARYAEIEDGDLFALNYTTFPISEAEAEIWEGVRASDEANPHIPLGEKRHFVFLLSQCTPALVDLDGDNEKHEMYGKLERAVDCMGAWKAPSMRRGFHSLTVVDAAFRECFPGEEHRADLRSPKERKEVKPGGDILVNNTVAYKIEDGGVPRRFGDLTELAEEFLGRRVPPDVRAEQAVKELVIKTRGWEREPRGKSRRTSRFLRLLPALARALRRAGLLPEDLAWQDMVERVHDRYRAIRPDGRLDLAGVLAVLNEVPQELMSVSVDAAGGVKRPVLAVVEYLKEQYGEHMYIDKAVSARDRDQQVIHLFDGDERDWKEYRFGASTKDAAKGETDSFRLRAIRPAMLAVYRDLGIEYPDSRQRLVKEEEVWDELASQRVVSTLSTFDYEREAELVHGEPVDPEKVRYFNVGKGQVWRLSMTDEDYKNGSISTLVPNEARYFAKWKMPFPHDEGSDFYAQSAEGILGNVDLVEYFMQVIAGRLLPRHFRAAEWLNLLGGEGSGKSSLMAGPVAALGEFADDSVEFETLCKAAKAATTDPRTMGDRARLVKRALLVMHEVGGLADAGLIKKLTELRKVTMGAMHTNNYSMYVDGLLAACANNVLKFSEIQGMNRRTRTFRCEQAFNANVKLKRDGMESLMRAEGPAVLRSLMTCAEEIIHDRHASGDLKKETTIPMAVKEATRHALVSSDSILGTFSNMFLSRAMAVARVASLGEMKEGEEIDMGMMPLADPESVGEVRLVRGKQSSGNLGDGTGLTNAMEVLCDQQGYSDMNPKRMTGHFTRIPGVPIPQGRGKDEFVLYPTVLAAQVFKELGKEKSWEGFERLFTAAAGATVYEGNFGRVMRGGVPDYVEAALKKRGGGDAQ